MLGWCQKLWFPMVRSIFSNTFVVMFLMLVMMLLSFGASASGVGQSFEFTRAAEPVWPLLDRAGRGNRIWRPFSTNKRFAVFDNRTREDSADDLVWDRETGYIWPRVPQVVRTPWGRATQLCRNLRVAGRMGFHLPSVEVLSTLIDMDAAAPPFLPLGHPFELSDGRYWTATTDIFEFPDTAWFVNFWADGQTVAGPVDTAPKWSEHHVWCVRGGIQTDTGVNTQR